MADKERYVKVLKDHNLQALFEPVTLADILLAVHHTPVEVSGLAQVTFEGNTFTFRNEPEIFEQHCSMGFTDFDIKTYHDWHAGMLKEKKINELQSMRLWWHSHVWGYASFSTIDTGTMNQLGRGFDKWWVALVLNKYGEYMLWVNVYRPQRLPALQISEIKLTEPMDKEAFRVLMEERSERMQEILQQKVHTTPEKPFERILEGIFPYKRDESSSWSTL